MQILLHYLAFEFAVLDLLSLRLLERNTENLSKCSLIKQPKCNLLMANRLQVAHL